MGDLAEKILGALAAAAIIGLWGLCKKRPRRYQKLLPYLAISLFFIAALLAAWNFGGMYAETAIYAKLTADYHQIDDAAASIRVSWWVVGGFMALTQYVAWLPWIQSLLDADPDDKPQAESG
ncbi:MAG TPA: hypothetical protein VHE09_03565 [Rhizomicrobium sp.]|nr:hypothetical protein [Rhizomicrobium sp.]